MNSFRWLHLSDIHYANKNYNTNRMRDSLLREISKEAEEKPFNFIVISGDITHQGGPYKDAGEFLKMLLKACKLDTNRLYLVPGNHDIPRSTSRTQLIRGIKHDSSPEAFADDTIILLKNGQKKYYKFESELCKRKLGKTQIHSMQEIDECFIILLNSALISSVDQEEGSLLLSMNHLRNEIVKITDPSKPIIAVAHHSLDCLAVSERDKVINLFCDYGIDMFLCGHIHEATIGISSDGNKKIRTVTCGATVVNDFSSASYVTTDFNHLDCTVSSKFNKWSSKLEKWCSDVEVSRGAENASSTHYIERLNTSNRTYAAIGSVDEDEFSSFILALQERIGELKEANDLNYVMKDVEDKFRNMKISTTFEKDFESLSVYFPLIDHMLGDDYSSSLYMKRLIASTIIRSYNHNFSEYATGSLLFEAIISDLCNQFLDIAQISRSKFLLYLRIIVHYTIYTCDIFNESK